MTEYRRILLDGAAVSVVRDGDVLRAGDGREVKADEAVHLPPQSATLISTGSKGHPSCASPST